MNNLEAANAAAQLVKQGAAATASTIVRSVDQELIHMRQALNSISQGVLITDSQRRTTYVNDAFEQMTGYAKSEIIGGSCAMLQGVGTDSETVNTLRTALNAGQSFHAEILNYRKNGSSFWNELSINPIRLFRSKNTGLSTLTFFNNEMQVAIQERVTFKREIHTALECQQFLLYYQIQVDSTHRTLGAEALIR